MDDLLREFLTETSEHLDTVDLELVRFEQDPNNQTILRNIFRLVHTIKGTCGFLGLPRLVQKQSPLHQQEHQEHTSTPNTPMKKIPHTAPRKMYWRCSSF